eukprot:gene21089-biopygen13165
MLVACSPHNRVQPLESQGVECAVGVLRGFVRPVLTSWDGDGDGDRDGSFAELRASLERTGVEVHSWSALFHLQSPEEWGGGVTGPPTALPPPPSPHSPSPLVELEDLAQTLGKTKTDADRTIEVKETDTCWTRRFSFCEPAGHAAAAGTRPCSPPVDLWTLAARARAPLERPGFGGTRCNNGMPAGPGSASPDPNWGNFKWGE